MAFDMVRCPGCNVKMDLSSFEQRPEQVICPRCGTRSLIPSLDRSTQSEEFSKNNQAFESQSYMQDLQVRTKAKQEIPQSHPCKPNSVTNGNVSSSFSNKIQNENENKNKNKNKDEDLINSVYLANASPGSLNQSASQLPVFSMQQAVADSGSAATASSAASLPVQAPIEPLAASFSATPTQGLAQTSKSPASLLKQPATLPLDKRGNSEALIFAFLSFLLGVVCLPLAGFVWAFLAFRMTSEQSAYGLRAAYSSATRVLSFISIVFNLLLLILQLTVVLGAIDIPLQIDSFFGQLIY